MGSQPLQFLLAWWITLFVLSACICVFSFFFFLYTGAKNTTLCIFINAKVQSPQCLLCCSLERLLPFIASDFKFSQFVLKPLTDLVFGFYLQIHAAMIEDFLKTGGFYKRQTTRFVTKQKQTNRPAYKFSNMSDIVLNCLLLFYLWTVYLWWLSKSC